MSEIETKLNVITDLIKQHGLEALLLNRASSFAWATCGASSYINTASSDGVGSLLFIPASRFLIANNIETPRFDKEERLAEAGWQFERNPWFEASNAVARLAKDMKLGADSPYPNAIDLSGAISHLRINLTPEEDERFRTLGRICAEAMDHAIRRVQPGMTEYEIAGILGEEAQSRGAQPIVNLIATDERIFRYRHPLPTEKKMDRYAMLVLCGRWKGLVCSITRLVHFGRLSEELHKKVEACARIDATFIHFSRPGAKVSEIFQKAVDAYDTTGFPGEWQLHHQGGPAGYEPREYIATPSSQETVAAGQVYAWNPSITGTKSEDTVLVGENGNEVLTAIPGWPTVTVTVEGKSYDRPAILEII